MRSNARARRWLVIMSLIGGATSIFAVGGAMAGPIQDIPSSMGDALEISDDLAKMILSVAILTSAGLALAVGKGSNLMVTVIILLGVMGVLTAIGWLTPWLLLLSAVLIAAMFAGKMKDALTTKGA